MKIRIFQERKRCLSDLAVIPTMGVPNGQHGSKHIIPQVRFHHDFVREHATIPTDMLHLSGSCIIFVAQPKTGMSSDIELAVRIVRQAMAARLIVRTTTKHGGIVLGDVKINHPGLEDVDDLA